MCVCVEVRGQLLRSVLSHACRFWGLSSGFQACTGKCSWRLAILMVPFPNFSCCWSSVFRSQLVLLGENFGTVGSLSRSCGPASLRASHMGRGLTHGGPPSHTLKVVFHWLLIYLIVAKFPSHIMLDPKELHKYFSNKSLSLNFLLN